MRTALSSNYTAACLGRQVGMSCGGVDHTTQYSRGRDRKMAAGITEVRQLQVKHFILSLYFIYFLYFMSSSRLVDSARLKGRRKLFFFATNQTNKPCLPEIPLVISILRTPGEADWLSASRGAALIPENNAEIGTKNYLIVCFFKKKLFMLL